MLLAGTNTGGTINSQTFNPNVSLVKPNELTFGVYRATYGTVSDGFDVDMTVNLETQNSKASFLTDYSLKVHSMRMNVAGLFKNFAIHGRFGVLHQITGRTLDSAAMYATQGVSPGWNGGTPLSPQAGANNNLEPGVPNGAESRAFWIDVPMNVFQSNFNTGRFLIKTTGRTGDETSGDRPWGRANLEELYVILDNQPRRLKLAHVAGPTAQSTPWVAGDFLQVAGNRASEDGTPFYEFWMNNLWSGSGQYTMGDDGATGAMEGLADMLPWYLPIDPALGIPNQDAQRLGLNLRYREQNNRLRFATQQAGGFYVRRDGERIIDAILNGVALTTATVPFADIGVWMNPDTLVGMGYQEGEDVKWIKDVTSAAPLIFQRGITSAQWSIGSKVIPDTIRDYNMPTNIVVIGPKDDMSYNCWDNAMMKVDDYIHDTFSTQESPKPEALDNLPNEFITRLDLSNRITYGSPVLSDQPTIMGKNPNFVHPRNRLPIAFHEMGALFTEYPYTYTIVHLRNEIIRPSDPGDWTN